MFTLALRHPLLLVIWLSIALAQPALAAIEPLIIAPTYSVKAAQSTEITVLFTNSGRAPAVFSAPIVLPAELQTADGQITLELQRLEPVTATSTALQPSATLTQRYRLQLPAQLPSGIISLWAASAPKRPAYLVVAPSSSAAALAATEPSTDKSIAQTETEYIRVVPVAESIDEEVQRNVFLDNFYVYEPLYFLFGTNSANAKFQISFKYRFINETSDFAQRNPWATGFYVAYTQTSFWDLASESAPFRDTNFKPELFYQFNDVQLPFISENAHLDLRLGYQHESNGQDMDASRSLNIAYLEPAFHWTVFDTYRLSVAPRVWTYTGGKDGNPDIRRFRGRSSLTTTISQDGGLQLEAHMRGNPGSGNGSLQLDLSYPLSALSFLNLDFYLYGQFFTGYGESLLDFNRKDTRFRLGLGVVR